jgi:outer membrane protein TolC
MKRFLLAALFGGWATVGDAVTLEVLLQRTFEENPQIRSAKTNLEQAAGRRLIFHSVALPDALMGVAGGVQGGKRAGEDPVQPFGFGYGGFTQPLFNMEVPPSWRRGNIEILIAQQQLNVAVVEQLHAVRIAFYTALYNRDLEAFRRQQRERLQENVASQGSRYQSGLAQRSDFLGAEMQTQELDPRIDAAQRAYEDALLKLSEGTGRHFSRSAPELEGSLAHGSIDVDWQKASAMALQRPDLQLARLMVRAAGEDQRILEAAYYPIINVGVSGEYIPVSGVRREQGTGSPHASDDVISSEVRFGVGYTWRVVDNGKVSGAVGKQRAARETNELLLQKMERDVPRDLSRIQNSFHAITTSEKALQNASAAAEQNAATVERNLEGGIASQLEYRLAQNDLLEVKTTLLTLAYQKSLALAERDRATGRYLRFSEPGAMNH